MSRFKKKIDALMGHVNKLTEEHGNVSVMCAAIHAAIDNAKKQKASQETISFLENQIAELKELEAKKRTALMIMTGRVQQCQEFIDEDEDKELEAAVFDDLRKEIEIITINPANGQLTCGGAR